MVFTEEDKERVASQCVSQWDKAKQRGELDSEYELYAVRFDQSDYDGTKHTPSIALIYREPEPKAVGGWYYSVAWGSVSKSRGKWVFYKNDYVNWAEAGGVAWEGDMEEYEELIAKTTVSYPQWEYVVVVDE